MARFLNPYNFVRPLSRPDPEPVEPELRLLWRCPPPPHDRYTGLSGRITCRMTAVSPVFVSDSDGIQPGENDHKTYRFFQVEGERIIPASSLRGAVRSVYEAVTNSTWSIFEDQTLHFREDPNVARGLIPGGVFFDAKEQEWCVRLMTGTSSTGRNDYPDGPLYAAWVPRYTHPNSERPPVDLIGLEHGSLCFALISKEDYRDRRGRVRFTYWEVKKLGLENDRDEMERVAEQSGWKIAPGILCITGKNINRKHDERFFFETRADIRSIPDFEIARYNEAIRSMRQYHKERETPREELSRYHTNPEVEELLTLDNPLIRSADHLFPVYVKLTERGEVQYLAPVSIPRVLERRSFFQIMGDAGFGHVLPSTDFYQLSPADRLFGWVHQDADALDDDRPVAYRGRVRFSHADISDMPESPPLNGDLSILSAPKPTTTRFYVDLPGHIAPNVSLSDETLRYSNPGVRLRGRKVYRHHSGFDEAEAFMPPRAQNSNQNRSIVGAHPVGTEYTFTVEFENLQPVELGALLWALELFFDGFQGYHRIGYGKPLGFGSVAIQVTELALIDLGTRYTELSTLGKVEEDGLVVAPDELIVSLKTRFMRAFFQLYGPTQPDAQNFWELDNISDFCALVEDSEQLSVHYPRPHPQRDPAGKNYEWFMSNKRPPRSGGPQLVLPYAVDDTAGLPYIYWDRRERRVKTHD